MHDDDDRTPIDPDLMLLESHLDGELDPAEAAALAMRLSADPPLAATLAGLRSGRAGRSAVWAAAEPDDRAVEQLCWRVRGAVAAELNAVPPAARRRPFAPGSWQVARFTSAAAACLALGFFGGRLGRGPTPPPSVADATPLVQPSPVEIPITNEYGQTVASQRFSNPDQARRFLEDLHQAHDAAPATPVDGPTHTASELHY